MWVLLISKIVNGEYTYNLLIMGYFSTSSINEQPETCSFNSLTGGICETLSFLMKMSL